MRLFVYVFRTYTGEAYCCHVCDVQTTKIGSKWSNVELETKAGHLESFAMDNNIHTFQRDLCDVNTARKA